MEHPESAFSDRYDTEFGFRADSEKYSYFLRLNARQGDYNVYIFCYDRPLLEEHMTQAKEGIRFITPEYEELFRIPDGGKIRINWKDGKTKVDTVCRYIDDYHMETTSRLYHISEFAEIARQKGAVVEPLTPVLNGERKIPWNRVFDGSMDKIPGKYRLPALASEAFQERVKQAMRAAGYEFDRIESDYGCLRFDGDMRMSFGSWREAARWLEEALIDDPALSEKVSRILHPEEAEKIKVLVVEPKKEPYVKEISPGLESLQREVGGYIEAVYPFEDPVALICNEEGKLDGLPLNRALYNERGNLRDVISGTMLVVGLTEDNFGALSPELLEKYAEVYREPETFITINGAYYAYPIVEAGKEEADRIAADTISLYSRNGADVYNRSSPEKVQQAVVVRSGDDYPLRSTLLDIAGNEPEDARVALNLIKDLDRFYLEQGTPRYELYQIGNDDEDVFRNYGYRSLEEIRQDGLPVDGRNYACVYSGRLKPEDTLDSLYERFNLRIRFAQVHLKAAFMSQQPKYKIYSEELLNLSQFRFVDQLIASEVTSNGCFYKLKSFADIVTVPLIESMETLFNHSGQNSQQGAILVEKKRALQKWISNFRVNAKTQIDTFIIQVTNDLKKRTASFAEDNYNNPNAGKLWNEYINRQRITERGQRLLEGLGEQCEGELKEIVREVEFDIRFSFLANADRAIEMHRIIDGRRVWNWTTSILSGVLIIADLFVAAPLTLFGLGIGGLGLLGNWLFKDYEKKANNARQKLEKKLYSNIVSTMEALKKKMQCRSAYPSCSW